jgi:uncharacterized protein with PIN domain
LILDRSALVAIALDEAERDVLVAKINAAPSVACGSGHWAQAIAAWWRFGKSRHPAGLDFGDCITYATARLAGEPLLAKGEDFAKTDIDLA